MLSDRCHQTRTVERLPDINHAQKGRANRAKRQAPNARIQGTGADIVKEAMVRVARSPKLRSLGVYLLLQVHDELVLVCPDIPEVVAQAKEEVRRCMENSVPLSVPTRASIGDGPTWGDAKH